MDNRIEAVGILSIGVIIGYAVGIVTAETTSELGVQVVIIIILLTATVAIGRYLTKGLP